MQLESENCNRQYFDDINLKKKQNLSLRRIYDITGYKLHFHLIYILDLKLSS